MAKRNSITVYPDEKLRKKLDKASEKQGRSLNNLILWILNKWSKKDEKNK